MGVKAEAEGGVCDNRVSDGGSPGLRTLGDSWGLTRLTFRHNPARLLSVQRVTGVPIKPECR